MLNRYVELPLKQSFFLFGSRQTGKSTLIQTHTPEKTWKIDLLSSDLFFKYSRDPSLFRQEAEEKIKNEKIHTIFVDEIQRVPILLNEIQSLMGLWNGQFILTGSSARKLKKGGANLLAGRAVVKYLFPLIYEELKDGFKLEEVLLFGTLPAILGKTKEEKIQILSTYANTYLREEIQSEGIVRNLGGFSRFLDLSASQSGELVSFSAIGRECHLPTRTVQSYYEVLEDTLIGFRLEAWEKSIRKRLVSHPKFYFFDLGVTNAINRCLKGGLPSPLKGRLFEQFVILETYRLLHYHESEARLFFWRTNHGAEVDLLIEKHGEMIGAFEIKSSSNIAKADLSGLKSFQEDFPKTPCALVSTAIHAYQIDSIKILPWQVYLEKISSLL
ncbi:MAG: ATP-binding protein [Chlamydiae bacterium]|nr:ATP-binding protein [Chlamydiota bacterium]MBI3267080.1 ATP-binding protein [Chlamydiota bacterium]